VFLTKTLQATYLSLVLVQLSTGFHPQPAFLNFVQRLFLKQFQTGPLPLPLFSLLALLFLKMMDPLLVQRLRTLIL
jgi:hypothetical protein